MSAVRPARPGEINDLAAVLTRAFARDPFYSYLVGGASERQGFGVVEELSLPNTDVHGWLMLRPPG